MSDPTFLSGYLQIFKLVPYKDWESEHDSFQGNTHGCGDTGKWAWFRKQSFWVTALTDKGDPVPV
ncbi:hypothetical protein SCG7086_AA_00520 [Chlamydiales bacterium SCGC AG-110-P3]|nr:hypothetical protein SCG7086_AA_00520 [Chlamydiales bacterium SCGC AG-110-P3]